MPIFDASLRSVHPLLARSPLINTTTVKLLIKTTHGNTHIIPAWQPMYHPSSSTMLRLLGVQAGVEAASRIAGDKIGKRVVNETPADHGYFPTTLLHSVIHWVPPGGYSVQSYYQGYLATSGLGASIGVFIHDALRHQALLAHVSTEAQAKNLRHILQQHQLSKTSSVHLIGGDMTAQSNQTSKVLSAVLIEQGYPITQTNLDINDGQVAKTTSIAMDLKSGEISNAQNLVALIPSAYWQTPSTFSERLIEY